ncbi:glycosyltransferase family 2 protein [Neorhizobium huautlense]|uniref:glycosyltransferase family 2 protein n=1 Tax=Neorhizobium huautlense TaxID=67774 RepID=UPI001FE0A700|nr:glycosyltransferase family 2 protein [Neorhizobium huautlense]
MSQYLLNSVVILLSVVLLIPTAVLAVECFASSLRVQRKLRQRGTVRPTVGIIVPAHNEELQILDAVQNIKRQMHKGDRLVVVADNCSDLTASLARDAEVEVIERFDADHRGKGYALAAAIRYLAEAPPEVAVVIDADCWLEPGALDELAYMTAATNRPSQSRYLMIAPHNAGINLAVSEFAFLLKNRIRLLGLSKLGLPAQLTGSGMAFPWTILQNAQLANGNLVEDMKLGLDLACTGHAALFCDAAVVKSTFPYSRDGLRAQASRWDTGRFALTRSLLSALTCASTFRKKDYLALVVDALVPPLTLQAALLFLALVASAGLATSGMLNFPLLICIANVLIFGMTLIVIWWLHGRTVLPLRTMIQIPGYVADKLRLYPRHIFAPVSTQWVRTDRNRPTGM